MKKGDMIFVYGTLRRGEGADLSMRSGAEFVGEDEVNGTLYDLGWYPGLKDANTGGFDPSRTTVKGDVFRILDDHLPIQLDSYEGYPSLYDRMEVETRNSRFVWVYTYNGTPLGDSIPTGDWLNQTEQQAA